VPDRSCRSASAWIWASSKSCCHSTRKYFQIILGPRVFSVINWAGYSINN
jgi:hypothetical protein